MARTNALQFRRFYNLYFLLAAIIALLPYSISPISPITAVLPLMLVLVVTMIKDGYEDYVRAPPNPSPGSHSRASKQPLRRSCCRDLRTGCSPPHLPLFCFGCSPLSNPARAVR